MLTLHGVVGSPFVRKARIALAEKGLEYEFKQVNLFPASPEYRKISPLGRVPALTDGERAIPDSSVIIAYLEKIKPEPALYPSDPYEFARALWFEEYADGGLVTVIGQKIFFPKIVGPRFLKREPDLAAIQKAVDEEIPPMFDYLESQAPASGDAIVGKRFSVGDIGIACQLIQYRLAGYGVDAKRWPKLSAYLGRVCARPSVKARWDEESKVFGIAA
jgi:glutathione S-transferase